MCDVIIWPLHIYIWVKALPRMHAGTHINTRVYTHTKEIRQTRQLEGSGNLVLVLDSWVPLITGRDATEREAYFRQDWFYQCSSQNRRHWVNCKSPTTPSMMLYICFFSFLLSWVHLTLLIKAVWSPFPRAVNHSVPSFSPHHSSLLILFPVFKVLLWCWYLVCGTCSTYSLLAFFLSLSV